MAAPLERGLDVKDFVRAEIAEQLGELRLLEVHAAPLLECEVVEREAFVDRPAQQQAPEELALRARLTRVELVVAVVAERVDGMVAVADAVTERGAFERFGVAGLVVGLTREMKMKRRRELRVLVERAAHQLHRGVLAVDEVVEHQSDAGRIRRAIEWNGTQRARLRSLRPRRSLRARHAIERLPDRAIRSEE